MAFLPPDQQNQNAPAGQTTPNPAAGAPPQTGGSTGVGGAAPKAGSAPNTASPTQFGSGAQNLQAYLTANAPQITSEANNIAGNLNAGYGQVSGDINNAANNFGQTVQAGYTAPNQAVDTAAAANPAGFVSTPGNISAFQGQYNDTYTGPQSFESTTPYSNIQNEVSTAVNDASQMQTPAGLQTYFAGTEQNPTNAETTLDSLLLSGNPGAEQQVNNAAGQYANLTPQLTNATTAADADVAAAQTQAQQAQEAAQAAINPVVGQENTALQNELTAAQTQANAYNTDVTGAQNQAQEINQVLNSEPQTFQNVPNYSLSNFLNGLGNPVTQDLSLAPISTPATQANTATAQDYATTNALGQLLGGNYTDPLNQANANQAGTFQIPTQTNPAGVQESPVTAANVTQNLANWLQGTEEPAVQNSEAQLNNPAPGSDQAGVMQAAEQANFIQALEKADPGLAAALATPQTIQPR